MMRSNLGSSVEFSGVSDVFPEHTKAFKQVQVCLDVNIPCSHLEIGRVLRITCDVNILNSKMVHIPRSSSHGGQILTGLMLEALGRVDGNVEYIPGCPERSVSSVSFTKLFSTYIVLDERFTYDSDVTVTPYIEDIYMRLINNRRLAGSVMLLLDVVPLPL